MLVRCVGMALNSVSFLLFLCVVCLSSYLLSSKIRYVWLLFCSYAFYLYDPTDFSRNIVPLLILVAATLLSYGCGVGIGYFKHIVMRRLFLCLSLVGCLGALFVFKYFNFFTGGVESVVAALGGKWEGVRLNLLMPLGISYYTLQAVGYTIDVYTKMRPAELNPLRYALFVSFFPGIVTGPINRADDMLPQYKEPARFDYNKVAGGAFRMLWGFFKKMVLADNIAVYTAIVLKVPGDHTGPMVLLASLLFAYQLYVDFGGSCDIAIGAARMLGFTFTENFNRPFAAKTFPALWQRWHISLTSFLRDYLFTPLVWSRWTEKIPFIGSKVKKPPMLSATLIVFVISGLWHGANIHYIFWGLANGLIMIAAQLWGKRKEKLAASVPVYRSRYIRGVVQRVLVYLMFSGCLVFFSAALFNTPVLEWFQKLGTGWSTVMPGGGFLLGLRSNGLDWQTLAVLAAGIPLVELIEKFGVAPARGRDGTMADWIRRRIFLVRWPLYYVLLAGILLFAAFGHSPFIYQQY